MGDCPKVMEMPIDMLKKGLKALKKHINARKSKIQADLDAQKSITESDEAWLDGEGNPVDEERVIDLLENASDYDQGFAGLCEMDKNVVRRLKILAGAIAAPTAVGKKRKGISSLIFPVTWKLQSFLSFHRSRARSKGLGIKKGIKHWQSACFYEERKYNTYTAH